MSVLSSPWPACLTAAQTTASAVKVVLLLGRLLACWGDQPSKQVFSTYAKPLHSTQPDQRHNCKVGGPAGGHCNTQNNNWDCTCDAMQH
jgi:hypothetical protein